jgi:hypothetical protein
MVRIRTLAGMPPKSRIGTKLLGRTDKCQKQPHKTVRETILQQPDLERYSVAPDDELYRVLLDSTGPLRASRLWALLSLGQSRL